ncbi:hypothetical protein GLOTRDRAFT_125434 [Gloeophyllum trabeum ATCC 11539]|uniref:Uncharacterized protein n=1 Tax=Gloeophyllum trabeum (strain ATCC 11539 / FP-39264 / Madison 617) TaxID=670483 RepID=S7S094_GLOTA|nr:uncharacterized protein GLOTRDRAFT_125434 [Gloeophyllum trabeum ATCC 11539]EPQ59124.1 hypothetical protein GLOTRDRAFT_125434 [Gloeophyllum trabeum ATCC 11539]
MPLDNFCDAVALGLLLICVDAARQAKKHSNAREASENGAYNSARAWGMITYRKRWAEQVLERL